MSRPSLIVFSGLPGTGKSTLARGLAETLDLVYLRVDSCEEALQASRLGLSDVMDAGYRVLWAIAADNLGLGRGVVGDCVNPIPETRAGWRHVAHRTDARLIEVEVVCRDRAEHKARIGRRYGTGVGPSWAEVRVRAYVPRSSPRIVIDTSGREPDDLIGDLVLRIHDLG